MGEWKGIEVSLEVLVPAKIYRTAVLESSNLDTTAKTQIEGMPRTVNNGQNSVSSLKKVKEMMLRYKLSETIFSADLDDSV